MTVAVSKALEEGAPAVVCASTGNTAASAAAYAARAGICRRSSCQPAGGGRARQDRPGARGRRAAARGARAVRRALDAARELGRRAARTSSSTRSTPTGIEGQKTAAFEIVEELGGAPDVLALPYGGGGNTRAYARGFGEPASAAALPRRRGGRPRATRSRPRSASPSPRMRARSRRRSRARAARSSRSPTRRSSTRGATLARASRASSASPPRPPASRPSRASAPSRARVVVCVVTGPRAQGPGGGRRASPAAGRGRRRPDAIAEAAS